MICKENFTIFFLTNRKIHYNFAAINELKNYYETNCVQNDWFEPVVCAQVIAGDDKKKFNVR